MTEIRMIKGEGHMAIIYDDRKKTFTLNTESTTYQMQVDRYGFLLHPQEMYPVRVYSRRC